MGCGCSASSGAAEAELPGFCSCADGQRVCFGVSAAGRAVCGPGWRSWGRGRSSRSRRSRLPSGSLGPLGPLGPRVSLVSLDAAGGQWRRNRRNVALTRSGRRSETTRACGVPRVPDVIWQALRGPASGPGQHRLSLPSLSWQAGPARCGSDPVITGTPSHRAGPGRPGPGCQPALDGHELPQTRHLTGRKRLPRDTPQTQVVAGRSQGRRVVATRRLRAGLWGWSRVAGGAGGAGGAGVPGGDGVHAAGPAERAPAALTPKTPAHGQLLHADRRRGDRCCDGRSVRCAAG
jgi:hypothetical protein